MANIVRLRVERKDGPDAFKNMLKAWKRQKKWIDKEHKIHSSFETESQKKRRRRRRNWIKKQQELNCKPESVILLE
jgi:hypothetical protein